MKRTLLQLAVAALLHVNVATAQPLVTGDLSVYYDFDEVIDDTTIPDNSGNGLDGVIGEAAFHDALSDGQPDIVLDTEDNVRGNGAIWFNTELPMHDDYIAIGGCAPGEICDVPSELIPRNAITIAAWLNVTPLGEGGAGSGDMSIYQTRSATGSFTHTQLQNDGKFRLQLRGQDQGTNIVNAQFYTDGTTDNVDAAYPRGEWFHWAATYDSAADMWAMYYNGEEIWTDFVNTFGEPVGDWGQGALLGLVPDINRQLVGKMDEFYLFSRALSADEIAILANPPEEPTGVDGDYNNNGRVEQADLDLVLLNWGAAFDALPAEWEHQLPSAGIVDQAELDGVLLNWGNNLSGASVPEPGSIALLILCGCLMLRMRSFRGMCQCT